MHAYQSLTKKAKPNKKGCEGCASSMRSKAAHKVRVGDSNPADRRKYQEKRLKKGRAVSAF